MSAQAIAMVIVDTIRRAVAEVEAENVDGAALNNALKNIDMTVGGYGEAIKYREGFDSFYPMVRIAECRVTEGEDRWYPITEWFLPPSLPGQ